MLHDKWRVAQNTQRSGGNAIDGRTARHASYRISQAKRPLIEKVFDWMKRTGGMRKTRLRELLKVSWQFLMTAAAYNLWRSPKLQQAEVRPGGEKRRISTRRALNEVPGRPGKHVKPAVIPSYESQFVQWKPALQQVLRWSINGGYRKPPPPDRSRRAASARQRRSERAGLSGSTPLPNPLNWYFYVISRSGRSRRPLDRLPCNGEHLR
jgi:hypothetical protein